MKTFQRITESLYIVFALLFTYRSVIAYNTGDTKLYLYIVLGILSVGMYFFKKKYRKKFDKNNSSTS